MRSQHVAEFNHDPWAIGYDENVRNEADPIRTGYADLLAWTVQCAEITPAHVVVDLGAGTGNTSTQISAAREVICVDISIEMMKLARPKLTHLGKVRFVQADLLEFFEQRQPFDRLISTYAIHHLTELEKAQLFELIWRDLAPNGRAVFGDLMFADEAAKAAIEHKYASSDNADLAESLQEEFFWLVEPTHRRLSELGFQIIEIKQFSELSWGICVAKPPTV